MLVVVDQLPSWSFERDRAQFHGGFARLLRDGAYVRAADIPYASTTTAPGHAAIATGAAPNVTGIIGNGWFRRAEGSDRGAEYDPDAEPLVVGAPLDHTPMTSDLGASGRALRVDGLADSLRVATSGRAHSLSIAFKARTACMMTGRRPDLAVWFEAAAGGMTTSRAYAGETPAWLVQLATSSPASRYLGARWEPRDAELLARVTGGPDDAPGEGGEHGFGATFPHALASSKEPARALALTPFSDEIVLTAVAAAIDGMELGKDDTTDLLAIGFSAHDLVGHNWGPDSWEQLDLTMRLDDGLGRLFDTLDRRLGKDRWAVVLTSDHGVTPMPDTHPGTRRIPPAEIERAADQAIAAHARAGKWVERLTSNNLYLAHAVSELPNRDEVLDAAVDAIAKLPNIGGAWRTDKLAGNCAARAGLERMVCLSIVPDDSGEIFVVPARGSVISGATFGTGHDAPFDDNTKVPILVMAPGLSPQMATGSLLQVAPTLAALLNIPAPEASTMPPLLGLHAR